MKLSRRVMKTEQGERIPEGSYLLTVSKTGRGSLVELDREKLRSVISDVLGAEA